MRKAIIISILILVFPLMCNGQLNIEWIQRDSGTTLIYHNPFPPPFPAQVDHPLSGLKLDNMGNVYTIGYTDVYSNSNDVIVCKYSENGDLIWRKIFDNNGNSEKTKTFCVDKEDNIIVGVESGDYLILKLDSSGSILWTKSLPNNNVLDLGFLGVGVDSSNNIYSAYTVRYGNKKMPAVLKLSENGDSICYNEISQNTALDLWGKTILFDKFGNFYIAGGIKTNPYSSFLVKLDSSTNVIWFDTVQINQTSEGISLCADTSNSIYMLVGVNYYSGSQRRFGIIKYDLDGNKIFRYLSERSFLKMSKINYDPSGAIYIGGYGLQVYKFDTLGIPLWTFSHNIGATEYTDAVLDEYGNYYIGTDVKTDSNYQFTLSAITPYGTLRNSVNYIGPIHNIGIAPNVTGYHFFNSILVSKNNIYMNGYTIGSYRHFDIVTLKCTQYTNIKSISNFSNSFSLHQNYPNPFNPSTKIKFDIPKGTLVKLKVYDLLGHEVAELVNERLNAGVYEYEWSGVGLPSGIYFYKLSATGGAGEFSETRKMMLVK